MQSGALSDLRRPPSHALEACACPPLIQPLGTGAHLGAEHLVPAELEIHEVETVRWNVGCGGEVQEARRKVLEACLCDDSRSDGMRARLVIMVSSFSDAQSSTSGARKSSRWLSRGKGRPSR